MNILIGIGYVVCYLTAVFVLSLILGKLNDFLTDKYEQEIKEVKPNYILLIVFGLISFGITFYYLELPLIASIGICIGVIFILYIFRMFMTIILVEGLPLGIILLLSIIVYYINKDGGTTEADSGNAMLTAIINFAFLFIGYFASRDR